MASILLDNWGLETFCRLVDKFPNQNINDFKEDEKECWDYIIMALVMWDDLFYLPSRYSINIHDIGAQKLKNEIASPLFNNTTDHISNVFSEESIQVFVDKGIWDKCITNKDISDFARYIYNSIYKDSSNESYKIANKHFIENAEHDARKYLFLSSFLGINYLPHPIRAQEIHKNNLVKELNTNIHKFSRLNMLKAVDKEVEAFYDKLNKDTETDFELSAPLLLNYIRKNANNLDEELKFALEIRNHNDVKLFRSEMDSLEESVYKGDKTQINKVIERIRDVSKQIVSSVYTDYGEIEDKIKFYPFKAIKTGLLEDIIGFEINYKKKINNNRKRSIGLTFVSTLIKTEIVGDTVPVRV